MTTPEELGMVRPTGSDLISQGDDAISQNALAVAAIWDQLAASAANRPEIGSSVDLNTVKKPGLHPIRFSSNANSPGYAGSMLVGQSYNGTFEQVTQLFMGQPNAVFYRSSRDGLWRDWEQLATVEQIEAVASKFETRRVLHQLSFPGNGNLRDSAVTRHVRVPVEVAETVHLWDITLKNFNEQTKQNYGDLDFVDVWIGKAVKLGNGGYSQNYAEQPTNLGALAAFGSGASRRYMLTNIEYTLEKGEEYLVSYGFTDPNPEVPNHMGIGGCWLGTDPTMVGRYDPPVSNAWSVNIPLDFYLTLHAPKNARVVAYVDSSSGTGYGADNPTRDTWGYRHAKSVGAFPVLLGHSGSTLGVWADPARYVWSKLGSTFDLADEAFIAVGSNDWAVYGDIPDMKSNLAALVVLVKTYMAETISFANIFPRASNTAVKLAQLAEWNDYLSTLPHGALQVIDRHSAIVGADGHMKPEYNSGDGTHLNTMGYAQLGQAAISGQVLQRQYTVKETAGRTVTVWDYLNNREQLIYGDTGWRSLAVPAVAPLDGSGSILIRRVGSRVTLQFDSVGYTGAGTPEYMTAAGFLPNGFCPEYFDNPHGLISNISTNRFYFIGILQASRLRFSHFLVAAPGIGTNALRGQISWTTTQTWPTTLPGVAA